MSPDPDVSHPRATRVTCVIEKSPLPDTTGSRRRIRRLIEAFANEFSVRVVIVGRVSTEEFDALQAWEVGPVTVITPRTRSRTGRRMPMLGRHHQRRWRGVLLAEVVQELRAALVDGETPDLVWFSGTWANELLPATTARFVVDLQHAEHIATRRTAVSYLRRPGFANLKRLIRLLQDAGPRRRDEQAMVARAELVTACSEIECAEVRDQCARPPAIVENGVDRPSSRYEPHPEPSRVLFVGNMHHPPNAEAARFAVERLMPRIRSSVPGAMLSVVGSHPPSLRDDLESSFVTFHGTVASVEPYYAAATVAIAPLRSGSGTKLKTLEALAFGVPLVATPIALEGIADIHDVTHLRIADDADSLALLAIEAMEHPEAARTMALAGQTAVFEQYTWESIGERACRLLTTAV